MTSVERKLYHKEYREKNKEKILEYQKEYRENNKEKIKECKKEYRENNKGKIKEQTKEYYENNKEKIKEQTKEYKKEYNKTTAGIKSNRIKNWKTRGVISDDYSSLYDYYLNCKNCEECSIELLEGNYGGNKKCLDHDHETGLFRNILCNSCNIKRG
jgi:hypothetical protein